MALRYRHAEDSEGLRQRRNAALDVMEQVRAVLNPDEDTVVSVTGHQCGDPECGSAETVILLMQPDRPTVAIKIAKSIETVTEADVSAALAPLRSSLRVICVR
jgi:hypothetical protein